MTGVHPDSLTSVQVIDLMTTTVLATEMLKKTQKKIFPGLTDSLTDSLTHMLTSRGASTEDLIRPYLKGIRTNSVLTSFIPG